MERITARWGRISTVAPCRITQGETEPMALIQVLAKRLKGGTDKLKGMMLAHVTLHWFTFRFWTDDLEAAITLWTGSRNPPYPHLY